MTLAGQLVGKTTKTALNGIFQEKQIVGAVELTQYTNVSLAFGVLMKQIKGAKSGLLIVAIKV